ncbi:c-type cytochrome [Methylocapsa acidiphila]|uniref:c-type cytochrome n=1 Tax=Methylocapsa acidiphila TaxID=133552 RepID=UPI000426DB6C|nr:c-type cytochrome [Methylocapsa acidiphila]
MRLVLSAALVLSSSIAAVAPSSAQETPGDAAAGRRIAEAWCAACHRIDAKDDRPLTEAPSFAEVAQLPSTTGLALNVFLHSSHENMPNFQLTQRESEDVIAYILSLKAR